MMGRYLLRRLGQTLLAVWLLTSVVFLISRRHADQALGLALPDSSEQLSHRASAAQMRASRATLRHRLGLGLPVFYVSRAAGGAWAWHGTRNQYHRWLRGLGHGNLGTSFRTGEPVTQRLAQALALTLPVTGLAAVLATLAALLLAQRLAAGPRWAAAVRAALVALHAVPLFVLALGLLLLFANPEVLDWFPVNELDQLAQGSPMARWAGSLPQLLLPVAALLLAALPELTLQLEAALTHELTRPYIATARAKGASTRAVIRHHALRNALLPTLGQVAELLPALVAGAVAVEVVFALPGMGRLLAEAAATRDYPVLVGGVLLLGTARLLALLLADLSYSWADPRIRWQA